MNNAISSENVFEMAIGMEQIGRDFYEALALGSENADVRTFCHRAAREEADHVAAFRQMRDRWAKSVQAHRQAPDDAGALAAFAKAHIQPDPAATRKVAIGGNLRDALNMAIQMEQDSIAFYQELAARLPDSASVIQSIVEVERGHLNSLRTFKA